MAKFCSKRSVCGNPICSGYFHDPIRPEPAASIYLGALIAEKEEKNWIPAQGHCCPVKNYGQCAWH